MIKHFILVIIFFNSLCYTHPVIWKNGIVANVKYTNKISEIKTHYSISNKWAIGAHAISIDQNSYLMVQNNALIKRWNRKKSQANIYLFSGVGANLNTSNTIGHFGIQSDWETQSLYTQASIDGFYTTNTYYIISTRFGFAPYIGSYNNINTWLILQCSNYIKNNNHELSILPVIRLFKDNVLIELGSNFNSNHLINFMFHI